MITPYNKFSPDNLKEYSKYLIEEYKEINNRWENSGMYYKLNQFYETGRIKELMSKNINLETKIEIINLLRDDIVKFSNDFKKNSDIDTFEDFKLNITSPEEYSMKKNSNKYNL